MRILLIPFSFLYYLAILLRGFFYSRGILKRHSLGAKVISVGNITWGGTGKTPAVLFIAERLMKEGHNPAILIRGYGKDEQVLLSRLAPQRVPVIVGKDRVKSGREAIARHLIDTILLDDGFQYRRLKRDLDIVCIDATNPFGNRCLIPAGSMREGLASLKRADIFLFTKTDLVKGQNKVKKLEVVLKKINPDALIVKSIHSPSYFYKLSNEQLVDIETLRNKNIALLSAIGNPRSFEKTILNMGLRSKKHFIFRDHHQYKDKELKKIEGYCAKNNIAVVITTEKDAVKLQNTRYRVRYMALRIELKITQNEQRFFDRLSGIYNS
ncbi:tetraacyldisaccharide 4'-kinase [Candidatus Omnitrophota bacterium]